MSKTIENVVLVRKTILSTVEGLSPEALNKVPTGFNNNIAWNMGHLVAAQQGICYLRAGLPPRVQEQYLIPYRPGTRPEGELPEQELQRIKDSMISSLDTLAPDLERQLFTNYTPWTTRYGVPIANIDEALGFLLFHEGLHFGSILALKKLV